MDTLQIILTTATTALTSAVVGAIVAASIAYVKDSKKGHDDMAAAQAEAIKLLVMDKAQYLAHKYAQEGSITPEQKAFVKMLTAVAHRMGANGRMSAVNDLVDTIPMVG